MENKKRIGFAMCGSYCTYSRVFEEAERLTEKYELIPIMSENAAETDSRFGAASENIKRLMQITGRHVVTTIAEAEPLSPREPMEAMVIKKFSSKTLPRDMLRAALNSMSYPAPINIAPYKNGRNKAGIAIILSTIYTAKNTARHTIVRIVFFCNSVNFFIFV